MRFFALQTDIGMLKQSLMGQQEIEVLTVQRHWLPFFFACLRFMFVTLLIIAVGFFLSYMEMPLGYFVLPAIIFLVLWCLFDVLRAYIDWRYTFLLLTVEKVVVVKQYLWFRREMIPIMLNNIASASVQSQYWDILPVGTIVIHLRESGFEPIVISYVHEPYYIVRKLSITVTNYNQRVGFLEKLKLANMFDNPPSS